MEEIRFQDIQKLSRNLYMIGDTYYKLFAHSITPNRCWLTSPVLREVIDIVAATGKVIFGTKEIQFDWVGTVPCCNEFITTPKVG